MYIGTNPSEPTYSVGSEIGTYNAPPEPAVQKSGGE